MIRVVVADDHRMLLEGLAAALSGAPDLTLVGTCGDGLTALRLIREQQPDVAVLDLNMPVRTGFDVLRAVQHEHLKTRVVVITSFDDNTHYGEAQALGAAGFLGKSAGINRLIEAVRTVASGQTWFEAGLGERAREAFSTDIPRGRNNPLTSREREILRFMSTGLTNREIATQLGTAEGTVKNQISSILSKLGVRDRTQAILTALRDGWI